MPRGAKPKIYPASLVKKVRDLYLSGSTQHEVAESVGLTQKVVWNLMRRHKIKSRVAAKRNQWRENNSSWKGDGAGKAAFHKRLYAKFGKPRKCAKCGTTKSDNYDYANLTGNYQDISDYAPMCRSCHWKYDNKIFNIRKMREKGGIHAKSS